MPDDPSVAAPVDPANTSTAFEHTDQPEPGTALCLSGGGYRAMLFHVGALWRLNEVGYLKKLDRISSVSGGSITAGVLGLKWSRLAFDASGVARKFGDELVTPIRSLADKTIDEGSVVSGILTPGSIADEVVEAYREHLFGDATLQDLPDDPPRFVINATSVQTGVLFRFSKPYIADYHVGMIRHPTVQLAQDERGRGAQDRLGAALDSCERRHRQPSAEPSQAPAHFLVWPAAAGIVLGNSFEHPELRSAGCAAVFNSTRLPNWRTRRPVSSGLTPSCRSG